MSCRLAAGMLLACGASWVLLVWCSPWALRSGFAGCMGSLSRLVSERGEAELRVGGRVDLPVWTFVWTPSVLILQRLDWPGTFLSCRPLQGPDGVLQVILCGQCTFSGMMLCCWS